MNTGTRPRRQGPDLTNLIHLQNIGDDHSDLQSSEQGLIYKEGDLSRELLELGVSPSNSASLQNGLSFSDQSPVLSSVYWSQGQSHKILIHDKFLPFNVEPYGCRFALPVAPWTV